MRKLPESAVNAEREMPVALFWAVTLASGTTAPVLSWIVPVTDALWARTRSGIQSTSNTGKTRSAVRRSELMGTTTKCLPKWRVAQLGIGCPIPLPMAEQKGSVHRAGEIAGRFGRIVHLFSKSIQRSGPKQHRRVGTIVKLN